MKTSFTTLFLWTIVVLALLVAGILLTGCSSSKLTSQTTQESHDTTIVIHPHTIIPPAIRDSLPPIWFHPSILVDSAIARKDSSEIIINIHDNTGKIIGKTKIKPFLNQQNTVIQPNPVQTADTTTKIKESKNTVNNYTAVIPWYSKLWTSIKNFILWILLGLVLVVVLIKYVPALLQRFMK